MILLLDNIRSAQNVGAIARTADAMGLKTIYTLGMTPHMKQVSDDRLPHVITTAEKRIAKTALGAESLLKKHFPTFEDFQAAYPNYQIVSVEQSASSVPIYKCPPLTPQTALVLGHEVDGVSDAILAASSLIVEIPMHGSKESLNVSAAAAIALYALT